MATKTRPARTKCRTCKSADLFSGYFDPEGYAVPLNVDDDPAWLARQVAAGVRWTTFCLNCGEEDKS